jgi:predicted Zn-dependent protease
MISYFVIFGIILLFCVYNVISLLKKVNSLEKKIYYLSLSVNSDDSFEILDDDDVEYVEVS